MIKYFHIMAILLLLTLPHHAVARENMAEYENKINTMQLRADSISSVIVHLMTTSDSLAGRIDKLKAKNDLGYFERKRLESLLKESDQLEEDLDTAHLRKQEIIENMIKIKRSYHAYLNHEINSLLKLKDQQKKLTGKIGRQLNNLIKKKQKLETELSANDQTTLAKIPTIKSSDTPDEIETKVDFYLDQIDKIESKAKDIKNKIDKINTETTIRQRMAELVDDVRLFDPRDESYEPAQSETPISENKLSRDYENELVPQFGADEKVTIGLADKILKFDHLQMSSLEVDQYIQLLETQRDQLLFIADSLKHIAEKYTRQAQKLRKSLK